MPDQSSSKFLKILLISLIVIAAGYVLFLVVIQKVHTGAQSARDTKVVNILSQLGNSAQIYYSQNNNSYTGICSVGSADQTGTYSYLSTTYYPSGTNVTCNSTANAYAVEANLPSGGYWCADSTKQSKAENSPLGTSAICP